MYLEAPIDRPGGSTWISSSTILASAFSLSVFGFELGLSLPSCSEASSLAASRNRIDQVLVVVSVLRWEESNQVKKTAKEAVKEVMVKVEVSEVEVVEKGWWKKKWRN